MAETIGLSLPRPSLQDDLAAVLAAHGLVAEPAGDGELQVRFADERERRLRAPAAGRLRRPVKAANLDCRPALPRIGRFLLLCCPRST